MPTYLRLRSLFLLQFHHSLFAPVLIVDHHGLILFMLLQFSLPHLENVLFLFRSRVFCHVHQCQVMPAISANDSNAQKLFHNLRHTLSRGFGARLQRSMIVLMYHLVFVVTAPSVNIAFDWSRSRMIHPTRQAGYDLVLEVFHFLRLMHCLSIILGQTQLSVSVWSERIDSTWLCTQD